MSLLFVWSCCTTDGVWTAEGVGSGYTGSLQTLSYTDSITAHAGGTQAGAVLLTTLLNRVSVVGTAGDSVKLPPSAQGVFITVINDSSLSMQVYGSGTDVVNDSAAATGVSQMQQSVCNYVCIEPDVWEAIGIGTGYNGSFQTLGYTDALSANSGGAQAGATPVTTTIARFTTVGAAGYSCVLPAAVPGMVIVVINAGVNSMACFPAGADQINSLAAAAAFTIPPGAVVNFTASVAGFWHTMFTNPTAALPFGLYNTTALASGVITASLLAGAQDVYLVSSGATALTTPTATAMLAAIPNGNVGMQWCLRIINTNGGTLTLTMDASVTATGTLTLATNTWRDFLMQITGTTTATMKSIGTGTYS